MSASITQSPRLSLLGAAVGLAIALIALFVICAIVQAIAPGLPATHAWIGLFTAAEPGSARAWAEGICYSAVFGFVGGAIFAAGYNAVLPRTA
jgi:hypothetical protein